MYVFCWSVANNMDPDREAVWSGSTVYLYAEIVYEPQHKISNNVVCVTSKASDQPAHSPSLIRAFASVAWVFYDC